MEDEAKSNNAYENNIILPPDFIASTNNFDFLSSSVAQVDISQYANGPFDSASTLNNGAFDACDDMESSKPFYANSSRYEMNFPFVYPSRAIAQSYLPIDHNPISGNAQLLDNMGTFIAPSFPSAITIGQGRNPNVGTPRATGWDFIEGQHQRPLFVNEDLRARTRAFSAPDQVRSWSRSSASDDQVDLNVPAKLRVSTRGSPRKRSVRDCSVEGCTKGERGTSGFCQKHGGGKRCEVPKCGKGAQGASGRCTKHGGGHRCTIPSCDTGARGATGLCAKHSRSATVKNAAIFKASLKRQRNEIGYTTDIATRGVCPICNEKVIGGVSFEPCMHVVHESCTNIENTAMCPHCGIYATQRTKFNDKNILNSFADRIPAESTSLDLVQPRASKDTFIKSASTTCSHHFLACSAPMYLCTTKHYPETVDATWTFVRPANRKCMFCTRRQELYYRNVSSTDVLRKLYPDCCENPLQEVDTIAGSYQCDCGNAYKYSWCRQKLFLGSLHCPYCAAHVGRESSQCSTCFLPNAKQHMRLQPV